MESKKRKRDNGVLLLLLLLLMIGGTVLYYSIYPYKHPGSMLPRPERLPEKLNSTENRQLASDSFAVGNIIDSFPTSRSSVLPKDTSSTAAVTSRIDISQPSTQMNTEPPPTALKEVEEALRGKKTLIQIPSDDDVLVMYDQEKKTVNVRPSKNEWSKMYLIYPSPEQKLLIRRNLMYPSFEGRVYPDYKKGKISHNGDIQNVVSVAMDREANMEQGYIIQAKSNPAFFIFGDYEDRNKWYIYENGQVRRFSPPDGFEIDIKEKL